MLLVKDNNLMLLQANKLSSHETFTRLPEGLTTLLEYTVRTLLHYAVETFKITNHSKSYCLLPRISSSFKGPHNKWWKRGSQQKHGVI